MSHPNLKKWRKPAQQISELTRGVLQPAMARRSGMTMDLLAGWKDIAGPKYCEHTLPEKISWPNRAGSQDAFLPGQLIVACEASIALFFQHELDQVVERVNIYFGYPAINKIKLVQKPVYQSPGEKRSKPAKLNTQKAQKLKSILDRVEDDELRSRLAKFGEGVMRKNQQNLK